MSVMRPEMVGSVASSSRVTAVAAPVRPELNTGSLVPTTVIVSETDGDLETEDEILRHAQADRKVVLRLCREPGNRRRHGVRTADPHAGHDESSVPCVTAS